MQDILWSRPTEFSDVEKLNELFKTDIGRRNFAKILDKFNKNVSSPSSPLPPLLFSFFNLLAHFYQQIPSVVMLDQSFELLLYLMNTFLQEMDISDRYSSPYKKKKTKTTKTTKRKETNHNSKMLILLQQGLHKRKDFDEDILFTQQGCPWKNRIHAGMFVRLRLRSYLPSISFRSCVHLPLGPSLTVSFRTS